MEQQVDREAASGKRGKHRNLRNRIETQTAILHRYRHGNHRIKH